jgi:anti-anti-sigma factor
MPAGGPSRTTLQSARGQLPGAKIGANVAELSELVTGQLADGTLHLTVDVGGLDFADTAGIRVFLLAAKALRQRGGDLVLLRPQRTLARILEILGVEEVLTIQGGTGATPEPES